MESCKTKPTAAGVIVGQAVYTKHVLSVYDLLVYGISNRFAWRCNSSQIEAHYNANVSSNHLEVGAGTGYLIDGCQFPTGNPRVALMDVNMNALDFASKRIGRYRPETYQQNILEEITHSIEPFDSVGRNYLFHCLPGTIAEKAAAFDHLRKVMSPGAKVFGSTILQRGVDRSWLAKGLMKLYNKEGIFSNREDSLEELETALINRFANIKLRVVGCVVLFSGQAL